MLERLEWQRALDRLAQTTVHRAQDDVLRALDAVADNQATATLYGAKIPRLRVNAWEHITRHLLPHHSAMFPQNDGWDRA